MSRSTKKGPFVDKKLLARIVEMNKKREKKVIRPGPGLPLYFLKWWATQ